jgi:hypothetical protein
MAMSGQFHAPATLPLLKVAGTHHMAGWVASRAGRVVLEKKEKSFVASRFGTRIAQPVGFTVSANRYSYSTVVRDPV